MLNDPDLDGFRFYEIPSGPSSHLTHAVVMVNGSFSKEAGESVKG